ncbi:histidine phosphatase family protein [Chelativorans sp.]|uniref:SixA phosphatase family protein n=1 Tax=Chelativorans sp. TaxID=2203393 RepID=UPI002810E8C4|nr:histidine phosphatase family protein [Chelativorans sp.]
MKELLLLRHAKSSWDDPSLDDFDRPLAPRGKKAAQRMGREMAAAGWIPERVLASPAMRTRLTWLRVMAELGESAPIADYDYSLYMASAETILTVIRTVPEEVSRLLVLGHNPGLQEAALGLAGPGSKKEPLGRLRAKFPTAAVARFTVDGLWSELGFGAARLTHFVRPSDLGQG